MARIQWTLYESRIWMKMRRSVSRAVHSQCDSLGLQQLEFTST